MKEKNFEEINKDLEKMFYESEDGYEYLVLFLSTRSRGKIKNNRNTLDVIAELAESHSIDRLKYLYDSILGEQDRSKNVIIPACIFLLSIIVAVATIIKDSGGASAISYLLLSVAVAMLYYYGYKYHRRFRRLYIHAFYLKKAIELKEKVEK